MIFDTDVLATQIETTLGPIIIATTYLPPRRPYLPVTDFYRLLNNNIPTYLVTLTGDTDTTEITITILWVKVYFN